MSNLQYKIRKIRAMSIGDITKKVTKIAYNKCYFNWKEAKLILNPIGIKGQYFKGFSSETPFLFNNQEKEHYIERLKYLKVEKEILFDAEKICKRIFNLLGSGDIQFKDSFPWNIDFKTNFKWDNKYYKKIRVVDLNNNADVKFPWEFSRFQHVPTLGKAYWITGDERYAIEFKAQLQDWMKKNPVEMSVNWTCAMDVAIRAVNWITGYHFFSKSNSIQEEFWVDFNESLYFHGDFIFNNLENKSTHTGNHYLSDIVGLIFIGMYFKDFACDSSEIKAKVALWLEFGIKELEKEMFIQVNKDGTNYETSTSYHRLVTELFLISTILCKKNDIEFSNEYLERLEKMCEFIMHIAKPNNSSPLIGDADDGRLLILSKYSNEVKDDFRHILNIAGEFFNRDDFRYYGGSNKEDSLWAIGDWKDIGKAKKLKSVEFSDGGYYILRNDRAFCCIRCGELSFRGEGVHSHNDQLSFVLNIDGEDIFVDPGTYVYTSNYKMRNIFRSTGMHNTLEIPGYEQNDFDVYNLFYMKEQTFSEVKKSSDNTFEAQHQGYLNKCGVIHNRYFNLDDNILSISDMLLGNEIPDYKLNFIVDTGTIITQQCNTISLLKNNVNVALDFYGEVSIRVEDIYISKRYGVKEESKKIIVDVIGDTVKTTISFIDQEGDLFEKDY
ncbi:MULTISPECIES: alginate lyase family protein [Bacillus cereus group]|uniref:alginate lyase family protein n=1 Tax=Bacillus cereus group TaxID=86661 RepID=UPI000BEC683F|nr:MULTISPECIES: alginate lyase family protein [Bacillus cereus group]PDY18710.1 hypothetical protein COM76_12430 [Bacillus cereus]PET65414.1 hypothetical protein CN522_10155 [Bacillus cereus]PEU56247.1 hypothetical protein CN414_14075 [Bacillus cereus]PEX78814.1 hypothetical protein CN457_13505 [Bacillus cereus]PEZ41163.1 hypothetical protein CN361_02935 [Bacillus cereus]